MSRLAEELTTRMDGRKQRIVAERMGISQNYLSDILGGKVSVEMPKGAIGILRLWPDMWPFFVPEDIARAIAMDVQRCEQAQTNG